jgi:hypothetical protein
MGRPRMESARTRRLPGSPSPVSQGASTGGAGSRCRASRSIPPESRDGGLRHHVADNVHPQCVLKGRSPDVVLRERLNAHPLAKPLIRPPEPAALTRAFKVVATAKKASIQNPFQARRLASEIGPERLGIDDATHMLQCVALGRRIFQAAVNVEAPRLTEHLGISFNASANTPRTASHCEILRDADSSRSPFCSAHSSSARYLNAYIFM